MSLPRVTVWNEFRHEKTDADVKAVYPDGIHEAIAAGAARAGPDCRHGHAGSSRRTA